MSKTGTEQVTNFMLAPGEKDVYGQIFMTSLATPYLKTRLMCSSTRFCYSAPNTLLGILPVGKSENIVPIRNIASVSSGTKFFPLRALLGVVGIIGGISSLPNLFSFILIILGILFLLMSAPAQIIITNPAGGRTSLIVSVLEKSKLRCFCTELQNRVFADHDAIRHDEAQALRLTQAQLAQMQLQQQQLANQLQMDSQSHQSQPRN